MEESENLIKSLLFKEIASIFEKNPKKQYNYKQIAGSIGVTDSASRRMVNDILEEMVKNDKIIELQRGKFKHNSVKPYITGIVDLKGNGSAFVISEEMEKDVYVPPRMVRNALHGDKVKVYVFTNKKLGTVEGEIVEILERAHSRFVGKIQISPRFAFFVPDNTKTGFDLFIPKENLKGAKDGQKVIAKITDWPRGAKNPIGEVIDVLGTPGDNDVEMHAILVEYGLPYTFPPEVETAAERIPIEITQAEIDKRKDFRKITTITIDPADAKDFDDALSIRKLDNSNWEIGVHIADVSHYVHPGSIIDEEAYKRGTSVYLVDRVVPMLPEKLSNNVCSLRPKEDKLCYSAVFEMDDNANIVSEWFGRTIINSDRRFTYEEAQKIIEERIGDFDAEILTLDRLAKKLREERFKSGSIDFHSIEVKFHLDEKGNPLGVFFKEQKDSNELIEDFMLLANKRVATYIGKTLSSQASNERKGKKKEVKAPFHADNDGMPFVYRVHASPEEDKLKNFSLFVGKIGYRLNIRSERDAMFALNRLLADVKGKKEENMISQLAIRTMAKAAYTTKNIGHYGLGFDYYSHFTSPIRRYPDLLVHRLLEEYLNGNEVSGKGLEDQCKHSSAMEKLAADAERASIKYKQAQFLEDKIGEIFDGVISGVTEWGIYVEIIENKCEGMVRLRDINDDFYIYDEENYCITGKKYKRKFQLGDKVKIEVKRVDLMRKQIDFYLTDEE
jgi:ribonuclease R